MSVAWSAEPADRGSDPSPGHYETVFGRSLDDRELSRVRRNRSLLELRVPARARRRAARLIATL